MIGGGSSKNVSLGANAQFTALNGFVALTGYYFAAWLIDYPWYGRVRMQNIGFFFSALFFFLCAGLYADLSRNNIPAFEFLYLASSFFGQFGPNVVTWILPVEIFPTDIRSEAHGFCAATGKLGALLASLMFTYGPNFIGSGNVGNIFWACGAFTLAGFVLTVLAVPDVTKENLRELDRRWSVDRKVVDTAAA